MILICPNGLVDLVTDDDFRQRALWKVRGRCLGCGERPPLKGAEKCAECLAKDEAEAKLAAGQPKPKSKPDVAGMKAELKALIAKHGK